MNFLSHYYFDSHQNNAYEVLGAVLPDLVKNANKTWNIHPEKQKHILLNSAGEAILKGWKKHLHIDRIFHNTSFFFFHQHELKLQFRELLRQTSVKPFFMGHIGLELILDHLLLKTNQIQIDQFYAHLSHVDDGELRKFLNLQGIADTELFFRYFDGFIKERYLANYIHTHRISYALERICSRLWPAPFTKETERALTRVIEKYIQQIEADFMLIFEEIEAELAR